MSSRPIHVPIGGDLALQGLGEQKSHMTSVSRNFGNSE